jgi:hypothetical protein
MAKSDRDVNNHNSKYHQYIEKSYFHVCAGKTVLEIGPSKGNQTPCIINNNPTSLTLIEADTDACQELTSRFPSLNVVNQDIFEYYKNPHKADVVVCCGVFYHLHNPFQLLELIVNQSDPDYLILDSTDIDAVSGWLGDCVNVFQGHPLFENENPDGYTTVYRNKNIHAVVIDDEKINIAGMRQATQGKNVAFSVIFHNDLYKTALGSMGYEIVKLDRLGKKFKTYSKFNNWMGLWKKI